LICFSVAIYRFLVVFVRFSDSKVVTFSFSVQKDILSFRVAIWAGTKALFKRRSAEVVGGDLSGSIEGQPRWLDESEVCTKVGSFPQRIFDDYQQYRAQRVRVNISGSLTDVQGTDNLP